MVKKKVGLFMIAILSFLMGGMFGLDQGADFYLSGICGVCLVSYWGVLFVLIFEIY